jgi:hypothetical protein
VCKLKKGVFGRDKVRFGEVGYFIVNISVSEVSYEREFFIIGVGRLVGVYFVGGLFVCWGCLCESCCWGGIGDLSYSVFRDIVGVGVNEGFFLEGWGKY